MKLSTYDVLGRPEDIEPILGIITKYTQFKHKPNSPDFFIVVGGDGSLVYKPNREKVYNSRILRVHYRKDHDMTLGCAADVNLKNFDVSLKDIIDGNYFLQKEKLIDCSINGEKKDSAINDVSIVNDKQLAMLLFDAVLYVDRREEMIPLSTADLILASTPYGSRAWTANTAGPIVIDLPDSMTINITGTSIKHEHFVTNSNNTLHVEVLCDALVGIDGRNPVYEVKNGDKISITGSDKHVSFIRTYNTLESLRDKTKRVVNYHLKPVKKSS